jgi:putative flippase GtrA
MRIDRYLFAGFLGLAVDTVSLVLLALTDDTPGFAVGAFLFSAVFLLFWPLPLVYPWATAAVGRSARDPTALIAVYAALAGLTIPPLWLIAEVYRAILSPHPSQAGLALFFVPVFRVVGFVGGLIVGLVLRALFRERPG